MSTFKQPRMPCATRWEHLKLCIPGIRHTSSSQMMTCRAECGIVWNWNDAGNREMEKCFKNNGIRRFSSFVFHSIRIELMCATKFSSNWVNGVITGFAVRDIRNMHIPSEMSRAQMQLFLFIFMGGQTFPWTASWLTLQFSRNRRNAKWIKLTYKLPNYVATRIQLPSTEVTLMWCCKRDCATSLSSSCVDIAVAPELNRRCKEEIRLIFFSNEFIATHMGPIASPPIHSPNVPSPSSSFIASSQKFDRSFRKSCFTSSSWCALLFLFRFCSFSWQNDGNANKAIGLIQFRFKLIINFHKLNVENEVEDDFSWKQIHAVEPIDSVRREIVQSTHTNNPLGLEGVSNESLSAVCFLHFKGIFPQSLTFVHFSNNKWGIASSFIQNETISENIRIFIAPIYYCAGVWEK